MALLLAGCEGPQSALSTAGPDAAAYALLGDVMFAGAGLIFIVVMALAAYAALAPAGRPAWLGRRAAIVAGGIVFPVLALTPLLSYGLWLAHDAERGEVRRSIPHDPDQTVNVEVIGELWWWRVRYVDEDGTVAFETANEIRIPTGQRVRLSLTSDNVIHSFWVPSLAGKIDMIPGRITTLAIQAEREGLYRGQCAEFCGAQHARMAFYVRAEDPQRFGEWLAARRRPAAEPEDALHRRGLEVFLSSGCGACHTVRGTPADGQIGPDLTNVGERASIAAGTMPNNVGTIGGWIASSQHIKPGNFMPSFEALTGQELGAVAAYLEGLK